MPTNISISQGLSATVDAADFAWLSRFKWHAARRKHTTYVATNIRGRSVLMHRLVLGAVAGQIVDHRDGNGLNNTRENLRIATPAENSANHKGQGESGFPGVRRIGGAWCATVNPDGLEIYLGRYSSKEEAAGVSVAAARRVFGEFVRDVGVVPDFNGLSESIRDKRERIIRLQREIQILGGA